MDYVELTEGGVYANNGAESVSALGRGLSICDVTARICSRLILRHCFDLWDFYHFRVVMYTHICSNTK